jgi:uncharacterized protein (TIGR02145 family)
MKNTVRKITYYLIIVQLFHISFFGCRKDDNSEIITDADGNAYKSVEIGSQVWMSKNLKTTRYNDGTDIPYVTDQTEWAALTTPAYCFYANYDVDNKATYGALYNFYTINTGKLCPAGWHVPTTYEWETLTVYLGDVMYAGKALKEAGTAHWHEPNSATNSSGFTALPGGARYGSDFYDLTWNGYWWSKTTYDSVSAYSQMMFYQHEWCSPVKINMGTGASVRCIKDPGWHSL